MSVLTAEQCKVTTPFPKRGDLLDTIDALRKQLEQEEGENVSLSRVVGERGKEIQALKGQISRMPCGHLRAELDTIRVGQGPGTGKQYCSGCEREQAQIASARLEEARLWDEREYICGEIDHAEGHKRFYPYCRVCARERIAELEKAEK